MSTKVRNPERPILMVDDEPAWSHSLALSLKVSAGIDHVIPCHDSREALGLLEKNEYSLVLLDLTMPYVSGETLLAKISETYPDIPVVIISGMNQIDTAIRCVKGGAADFYVKTDERERVVSGIVRVLKQNQLLHENRRLAEGLLQDNSEKNPAFAAIVTNNAKMRGIFSYLRAIAKSYEPILIIGESGTGKELIARALHQLRCPDKPWVAVNVAGLDDMVFSDTLFGHVKGAYTGADQNRKGMIEEAGDGVLFLDEIGDLAIASQVKLLRLLQEGEYYPLGSDRPCKSKARIVTATNQNLSAKEAEGSFRRDLHFRLCSHRVDLPPLRERKEDLPLLLEFFLTVAAESMEKNNPTIPPELLTLLSTYSFPGNVRELRAMAHDAVSVHPGGVLSMTRFKAAIDSNEQPFEKNVEVAGSSSAKVQFSEELPTLKELSQILINEALQRSQGNQSIAARMLGVTPQALSKRLKKPDIS
ncbi:MAG: sigma-54 dependent transcriptional regulator [Desulfuromusa sp.]|jgi:DNA-binding NtrC family response regulator|nr:sigma-54 dependent transcriptional regulator [Desulfuromusa sp.]